jgi:hypothetical protein
VYPLPDDILRRIRADFGDARAPAAETAVCDFAKAFERTCDEEPTPRLLRCIVYLAAGDHGALERAIATAGIDPRDVILAAEYDREDRHVRDFHQPFEAGARRP